MKTRPVVPRELASQDVYAAVEYYLTEGGTQASLNFIEALERAYNHIGCQPVVGSSRYAHEVNLPGLRFWPLKRYPHLVFYLECVEHIDVWRAPGRQRDIPAWVSDPDGDKR